MAEFLNLSPKSDKIIPYFGSIFTDEPLPKDGFIDLPDRPGFGVTLNREGLKRVHECVIFSCVSLLVCVVDGSTCTGRALVLLLPMLLASRRFSFLLVSLALRATVCSTTRRRRRHHHQQQHHNDMTQAPRRELGGQLQGQHQQARAHAGAHAVLKELEQGKTKARRRARIVHKHDATCGRILHQPGGGGATWRHTRRQVNKTTFALSTRSRLPPGVVKTE
jgi:hypothetical protein